MKCPDIETLIAIATGKGRTDDANVAVHVAACPDCRQNMKIIHETMMVSKWLNPKVEVSRQPVPEENRCSVCGTFYKSRSAIIRTCTEKGCKEPICFDCWMRLGVRKCKKHANAAKAEKKNV